LWQEILQGFQEGYFTPLSRHIFPLAEVQDAFRLMAQARHIGKIVLSFEKKQEVLISPQPQPLLSPDETYLITGGLGGLGLTVAEWMVERGARHLALLGRRAPSLAAQQVVESLRTQGARIEVLQADAASTGEMAAALQRIQAVLPPLRGIVHSAATLHDSILQNLDAQQFVSVLAPKVSGTWNLHQLTLNEPLKFFVLFSGGASIIGSPGQGNYASANSFLDGMAYYRHHLGLPALSINWGPWSDVGLAAQQANRGESMALHGFINIVPQQGTSALERLLRYGDRATQVAVLPLNVRQLRQSYPALAQASFFKRIVERQVSEAVHHNDVPLRQELLAAKIEERRNLLESHLQAQVAQVIRIAPDRIDTHVALNVMGLDSLMSLEIRNRFENSLGLTLQATLLWAYPTIHAQASYLAEKMEIPLDKQEVSDAERQKKEVPDTFVEEIREMPQEVVVDLLTRELEDLPSEFLN
ncbi:MAG: SDR family NAD(P)-dependent oxidoreductase, partial [Ktedonobacteraceae bacterium]|nr:SDR family NAD(P)-dependent oxidoreductase [Ktedonobacteraceae bacterium]